MTVGERVEPQPGAMSLTGHLAELRSRILWSGLAIAIGSAVGFALGPEIIAVLKAPIPSNIPLITTELGSAFSVRLQVAIVAGVILAMPVLLWHIWRFVAPGLTASERRAVLPWIPLALLFFSMGVGIAYLIMPFAAQFLFSFVTPDITPLVDIRSYFDFLTTLFLAFGVLMEFPILLVGLSRVGIITSERLRRSRRMVILIIAVFSAIATPGGDLVSPTVLGVTLYVLFEGTTWFIRRTGR